MAVTTAEGPLIQLGNRGYPPVLMQGGDQPPRLEVRREVKMFYVHSVYLSYVLWFCVLCVKGLLTIYLEGKSDYFISFRTRCKVNR